LEFSRTKTAPRHFVILEDLKTTQADRQARK